MKPEIAEWLRGQIQAIAILAEQVQKTADFHCPAAANELDAIKYSCNRADCAAIAAKHAETKP